MTILNTQIYFLLFSVVIITYCIGKDKPTVSENRGTESVETPKSDLQIAEYIRNIFQDKNGGLWFSHNNPNAEN